MKEAVSFLREVYDGSIMDIANILTAEADNDKETILKYLASVKEYTEGLIEKVKNNGSTRQNLHTDIPIR